MLQIIIHPFFMLGALERQSFIKIVIALPKRPQTKLAFHSAT
jgi:hypothetical protein